MSSAVQLREEALAKLIEAREYAAANGVEAEGGELPADKQPIFDGLMTEFRELDSKAQKAAANGDNVGTLRERMEWYTGKATGQVVPFTVRQIAAPGRGQSLGQAFVESQEYRDLLASGNLQSDRSSFRSVPFQAATTDIIQSTPSSGPGAALVTPEYLPGVIPLPQRDLTVRALFGQGTTQSDTISYAQQTAFDKASGLAVAQTVDPDAVSVGKKKQSSIAWARVTSPVETIATWMAATRQQLADAGQIRALIDNALRLMLGLEEEEQLLNGNGTSPNLSGIYDQAIQTSDVTGLTSDGEPNIDGIRNAARLVKVGLSRLTADAIVMNPTDSMYLDLTVDGEKRYRIGDPFSQGVGAGPRPIWGLRRVESEAIEEGHALIGAFNAGATVLERQGITILTADQHADFFVRNLVVVLAEERLGFPVYFPSAFVDLTLDTWSNVIGS